MYVGSFSKFWGIVVSVCNEIVVIESDVNRV